MRKQEPCVADPVLGTNLSEKQKELRQIFGDIVKKTGKVGVFLRWNPPEEAERLISFYRGQDGVIDAYTDDVPIDVDGGSYGLKKGKIVSQRTHLIGGLTGVLIVRDLDVRDRIARDLCQRYSGKAAYEVNTHLLDKKNKPYERSLEMYLFLTEVAEDAKTDPNIHINFLE